MTSMEESWTDWLCDMDPDDYSFINQSGINVGDIGSLASQHDIAAALQEENPQRLSFSTENTSTMSNSSVGTKSSLERPASKLLKTQHFSQKKASSPSSGSYILSFDNAINPPPIKVEPALKPETKVLNSKNEPRRATQKSNCKKTESLSRSIYHTPDHIIAERMRREKISQQFIALSALIPNLKKMDKASVLGDAIKYVKELKEQVKVKEEEQSKRKNMESVVPVNKYQPQLSADEDDTSSNSCNNNGNSSDDISKKNLSLPEVEAKVSGKNVLIRALCEKEKAVLVNIFTEIEKLHLSVISCSSLSFGSSVVAITIIAEKMEDDEFNNMGVEKLANNIRVGLLQLM